MSRYIHLNPVRLNKNENRPWDALGDALRAYRWSSYREYVRATKRRDRLTYGAAEGHVREVMVGFCVFGQGLEKALTIPIGPKDIAPLMPPRADVIDRPINEKIHKLPSQGLTALPDKTYPARQGMRDIQG